MNIKKILTIISAFTLSSAVTANDYNKEVLKTVEWLASNKAGLGYDLRSRYTEDLKYGDYTFRSSGGKTMCVAAVYEVLIRTLASAKDKDGVPVSENLLKGKVLAGAKALNILPYAFQFRSSAKIPEYNRFYSAGIGDAFVLFGMGRYVNFSSAKGGDFVYFNRANAGGHAVIFINYLDDLGKITTTSESAKGFRYFSAQQGGTNGMGYRDAFFGSCPKIETTYKKDCGLIKSEKRGTLAVSRLDDPKDWFTSFSAIRVERYFKGDSIDKISSDEGNFRSRARSELEEADAKAKKYASEGKFPLIVTEIAGEADAAQESLKNLEFDEDDFGLSFEE